MKAKLQSKILKLALATTLLLGNIMLFAQPPGGPPPGGGGATGTTPPCWEPECIPIDGGIVFLIVAGLFLAFRKLYTSTRMA